MRSLCAKKAVALLGCLLLAVAAFFPILYGTSVGDMSVLNFWRPFLDLTNYKTSAIAILLNGGAAGLFTRDEGRERDARGRRVRRREKAPHPPMDAGLCV